MEGKDIIAEDNGIVAEGNGIAAKDNDIVAEGNGMVVEGNGMVAGSWALSDRSLYYHRVRSVDADGNMVIGESDDVLVSCDS